MEGLLNFFNEYKVIDIVMGLIGLYGFVLIGERIKALYFDFSIPAEPFMKQVMALVKEDKIDEAITFCAANEKKPLAYVIKRVLERSDRDEKAVEQSLDIAASEVGPKLTKGMGHLAMIANVITLVGLLGTVFGLIMAFRAVSFADVTQKQTLLAQGISMAMTATALGLCIAIPTMFLYSFLFARQTKIFSEIDQYSHKVIETLNNRTYAPFHHAVAFPSQLKSEAMLGRSTPPPTKQKSS